MMSTKPRRAEARYRCGDGTTGHGPRSWQRREMRRASGDTHSNGRTFAGTRWGTRRVGTGTLLEPEPRASNERFGARTRDAAAKREDERLFDVQLQRTGISRSWCLRTYIGTTFIDPSTQLSAILNAPNADEQLRDLARLVSERGVVFFKAQDIQIADHLKLADRLGKLSGKPESSGLHIHPISESTPEFGPEVSVISSMGGISRANFVEGRRASAGWHADITFEKVPSDYAILKVHTLPKVGGDTLWASGYEAYDRLSPAFKRFLEGLTAVHNADFFNAYAKANGRKIQDPRGSPLNTGEDLSAVHPVIRTHPVTGYKTLFVNRTFTKRIVELTPDESEDVLQYLFRIIAENHDLQVRYRWGKDDVAIWDNRATFHTATLDYGNADRQGNRAVSLGEVPYYDEKSKGRREALGL
ncbi:hypothetical protein LXA43DRAFT_636798 [Ganoderma leucocontextum]|nr:hypothetical protein LXA43DRAFT_636798 [Ganoderma leucocontextum]